MEDPFKAGEGVRATPPHASPYAASPLASSVESGMHTESSMHDGAPGGVFWTDLERSQMSLGSAGGSGIDFPAALSPSASPPVPADAAGGSPVAQEGGHTGAPDGGLGAGSAPSAEDTGAACAPDDSGGAYPGGEPGFGGLGVIEEEERARGGGEDGEEGAQEEGGGGQRRKWSSVLPRPCLARSAPLCAACLSGCERRVSAMHACREGNTGQGAAAQRGGPERCEGGRGPGGARVALRRGHVWGPRGRGRGGGFPRGGGCLGAGATMARGGLAAAALTAR